MRIEVRTTSRLRALTEYVRQHAFMRFSELEYGDVKHVEARLFDDGGSFKTCRLVVELARQHRGDASFGPRIVVTEASCDDAFDAVDLAVDKAFQRAKRAGFAKERPSGVHLIHELEGAESTHRPLISAG
jgi:hypothetical protein